MRPSTRFPKYSAGFADVWVGTLWEDLAACIYGSGSGEHAPVSGSIEVKMLTKRVCVC